MSDLDFVCTNPGCLVITYLNVEWRIQGRCPGCGLLGEPEGEKERVER